MKKMFFKMFQMSLFNHILRLAIVVLCLSYSVAALAGGNKDYYSAVKVTITGGGKVYVKPEGSNSETLLPSTGVVTGNKNESWSANGSDPGKSANHSYTLRADASGTNYYFSGWKDGNNIISTNPYTVTISETKYTDENDAKTTPNKEIEAIFNPYVTLPKEIKFVVYSDEMDVASVQMKNIYKRTSLTLSLIGTDAGKFQLGKAIDNTSEESISFGSEDGLDGNTTKDLIYAYINYSDGEYDPEKALAVSDVKLRVVDNDNHTWEIPIKVTEPESYTFLSAAGGKYTVTFNNADQTKIENISEDQDPVYLRSDMYSFNLIATPDDGYKFFAWQTVDESGVGTLFPEKAYDSEISGLSFTSSTTIRPIFLPADQATFIIKEDPNKTPYYDLQEALDVAKANNYATVVFNAPTKGTTGTLYPRKNADGTIIPYVVPAGVTLLVPGNAAYTCVTNYDEIDKERDLSSTNAASCYSTLTLADNTQITLDGGHLSVYANICTVKEYNGMPVSYGWLKMGENCLISTTQAKPSNLLVLGYITGGNTSSVVLNEDAKAYESFQFTDFRGGTCMMLGGIMDNQYDVFPLGQYYIQNIEARMTIKHGAELIAIAALDINKLLTAPVDVIGSTKGIIRIGSNVEAVKWYDTQRDVQVYEMKGSGVESSSVAVGNLVMNLEGYQMNTANYVLPFTNNFEFIFENVKAQSQYPINMLAGSKMWIKEDAECDIQGPLYVYDADQSTIKYDGATYGYFNSTNKQFIPIKHTPNKTHTIRQSVTDAELKIDGKLVVSNDGLYTTESGALVTSATNNAIIEFRAARAKTSVYQVYQENTWNQQCHFIAIPVTSAKLKNSDNSYGEYVTTAGAVDAQYQFIVTGQDADDNPIGVWSLPPAQVVADTWMGTVCKATMPTLSVPMTVSCQVENVTSSNYTEAFVGSLDGTGFTFANGELANSISLEGNILSISVKYTPQNNTKDAHTATLTLRNAQFQTTEYTYTTTLIATEEYIPEFSIDKSDITLQTLNNSVELNNAFTITPAANNVATLGAADGLVWSYEILNKDDDNENTLFGYTQGSLIDGTIANNIVTFTANTTGTQYARLVITATYTPTEGGAQSFEKTINLIGTKLIENTLAFAMPTDIWVTDKNIPVAFSGKNNNGSIIVTLTSNGEDGSPVVELVETDGTYYINALRAGSFTMQASQVDNGGVAGTTKTCTIKVNKLTPNPTWNWGTVYGNQTYSTPFGPATVLDGKWTLVESSDPTNALAYDEATHTIQVMNVGNTTSAQFTFTQDETEIYNAFTQSYQVTINPDPRILTLVVDNKAKYDIVVADAHSDGVTCNEYGMITLPVNGYVVVQFIGIPGDLTFQISEGAEYSAISVAENTDKTNAETWSEITKSQLEDKWQFAYANSSCVKLTNTGDTEITLTNLTITENASYNRNTYYAKAEAIVYPEGAGLVAAKGNYLNTSDNYQEVFAKLSPFAARAIAYSTNTAEMTQVNDLLSFNFQAKSSSGYYLANWSALGATMIIANLSWADVRNNYELYLETTAQDKSIAYSFDTYINLFCQQNQEICSAAKPESGEPNPEAVAYMNAGALALIPATNVGTWQANFALAEVVSAENALWDEVTSPNASDVAKHAVVFNILGDDKNDFWATIEEDKGFTFTEDDITLSAVNNTYTINASYTPQDVHGTHTAMFTLARVAVEGVTDESKKTITLTAIENLTPAFILADANFGDGTLGQETIIDITPANKNKVAQVLDPAKLKWEASLSENAPFEIVSIAEDGTCKVRYFRIESVKKSATLTITATYTDSKGTEIPFATTCTLTGSSTAEKAANTLALVQDIVLYVDDEPISPFSVNDANNTAPITITLPEECTSLVVEDGMIKPSGDSTTGTFTITVAQAENDYFQASGSLTTTVTVKKHTPEVTWNWTDLYFGQTYTTPITTNSDGDVTITVLDDKNIVQYDTETKTLTTDPTLTEGEFNVNFLVSIKESNTYEAYSQTHTATLYKDPRHVRVDVNEALTYRSVTIANLTGENVSFADGGIHFADVVGSEYDSRRWTMYFIGVPDQLYFTPEGNNAWEIQESPNGTNWDPTFASSQLPAGEAFSMSLRPSTRYLRISYAKTADDIVERSNGVLNSFYITALEGVKANVDGLYMPIAADVVNSPTTKQMKLQYTSQEKLTISTSDPQFTVDVAELPALNVDEYAEQIVTITSKATQEKEGRIYVKNAAGDILLELPIYTFIFPQTLPIQLATDEPQRFYYVTTASNYVKWDMTTKVVTLQNAPANTTRSLTFAFDGAPTLLRYNHTAGDRGIWTIRESANNTDWYDADPTTRVVSGNEIEQGLLTTTRYVQLQYTSPYSEKVEVSNLIIVGDASVTTDVTVLKFTEQEPTKTLTITAFNLSAFNLSVDNANFMIGEFDKSGLGASVADVLVPITWAATKAVEYATLSITNPNDNDAVLATVELVGTRNSLSEPTNVGINTGLAEGVHFNGDAGKDFHGKESRPVDLTNVFDVATQSKALFDYLFIYGETSTMDGTSVITTPTGQRGSNAKTPCYIYQRVGDTYELYKVVDNVNSSEKAIPTYIPVPASDIPLRVYITGFAPYASTGYTKEDEGVWQFRGQAGSKLDIYLEDCYIYSRYKTIDGHSFLDRDNGESFGEQYARGSGGVLVFECSSVNNKENPFNVTIHTMDRNLLKSHYGCFLSSIVGRAYQVSSPVQIHLISTDITATTHLSFDDLWPTAITRTTTDGVVTAEEVSTKRTNGFISLQKQVNNAPSIDLGSPETVVNFNGGQVELQNAQNVSDNYKTTLAISYRGGKFASFFLAHGMGTDEVSGTVNFKDGTTTVIPMTVDERYRQYYLMDEDDPTKTSCLRTPTNTYVYGGSHCMMRACNDPTSKGGAPLSHAGEDAVRLGLYKYPYKEYYTTGEGGSVVTHAGGWTVIEGGNGRVEIPVDYIPNIKVDGQDARKYGVESVMPNDNGTPDDLTDDYLNFWVPAGYDDSVTPEVDMKISYWKAAMTHIKAEYASYGGEVGGNITIGDDSNVETELVYNLLYCALDEDIKDVISRKEEVNGQEVYSYAAPVKHPTGQGYLSIRPSFVGTDVVNYVENQNSYKVQNRVYYVTPIPSADNWMTFTAPFDVDNIYIVETYDERTLSTMHGGNKAQIKIEQAKHNADFAAFFGVALALGSDRDFDDIYANYIGWAKLQDVGKYTGQYDLRGKYPLEFYDGTNWSSANYYIYENQDVWTINSEGVFETQWTLPDMSDNILMNKGETYSLLFPYCTGCWEYDEDDNLVPRTMWDYWSGKFIIFESTYTNEPHVINGLNEAQKFVENNTPQEGETYITGNTSFGELKVTSANLYTYNSIDPMKEFFEQAENIEKIIWPTNSFALADIPKDEITKMPARGVSRTGEIIYHESGNSNQNGTTGHIPTVSGGNDLFITSIAGGINVAVAAPQNVRVLSSTGAVIYSGYIQTAVDIKLPTTGIYIVSGENEVQKILF